MERREGDETDVRRNLLTCSGVVGLCLWRAGADAGEAIRDQVRKDRVE